MAGAPMPRPLRALIVEDSEDDALLLVREVTRAGYDVTFERVQTDVSMLCALEAGRWDIVFSDYGIPGFGGMDALAALKRSHIDLPFIMVSGAIGEEMAVDALKAGAHDFLVKGKFSRLARAIERELEDAKVRRMHREAQEERNKLQSQLLVSDRMASVGTLAAGVAHELNNPLAAVIGNLEVIADDLREILGAENPEGALVRVQESVHFAREAADRMRSIIRDLKIFSRAEDETRGAVDVHALLDSVLRMAFNEIRHRARVAKDYGSVPRVEANESRLAQVFLNLVMNGAQAIPEGRADNNEIRVATRSFDPAFVAVEIRDSGCGMTPEVQKRLFTPFFTTKQVGTGLGLGLSICHRIVTSLGGRIEVESEVGRGTTFRVLVPIAQSAEQVQVAVPRVQVARRARVLIVDDDMVVAFALKRMLERSHEVTMKTSARQALDRITAGDRYDAILCDLMMPEMTGMELHAEIARAAPEQARRMIFLTGGAFTPRAREFLDQVANQRLEKPCDLSKLLALINDCSALERAA
jgi:signal transduction histidine kinase